MRGESGPRAKRRTKCERCLESKKRSKLREWDGQLCLSVPQPQVTRRCLRPGRSKDVEVTHQLKNMKGGEKLKHSVVS